MKFKLLVIALIFLGISNIAVYSAVSIEEITSNHYVRNNGYSASTADLINISKNRATGKEFYTEDEQKLRNSNKGLKFLRKFYMYTDPAAEDYSMFHHDMKVSPHYTDL